MLAWADCLQYTTLPPPLQAECGAGNPLLSWRITGGGSGTGRGERFSLSAPPNDEEERHRLLVRSLPVRLPAFSSAESWSRECLSGESKFPRQSFRRLFCFWQAAGQSGFDLFIPRRH
jgi:hypothetical protein